jgi:hypothetical protein
MSEKLPLFIEDARSYARPHVRRIRGKLQAAYNNLGQRLGFQRIEEPLREQWGRVLRRSAGTLDTLPEATGPRVLFATGYGLAGAMLTIESTLIMALRLRGAQPIVLLCDKTLPACEWNRFGNFDPAPGHFGPRTSERGKLERCRICTENITDAHGQLPVPLTAFRDHLRPDDFKRIIAITEAIPFEEYARFVYRDISVGEHAFASVMRATLRGTLLDNEESRWLFQRYLIAAIMVVDLTERIFAETRPDRVVAVHGIYVTHGTICEVARKHGIPVVVYGTPYRMNTIWLSHHDTYHRTLISEPTSAWESIEMTPERSRLVDDYLGSKRFGGRDYAAYHTDAVNDADVLRRELKLAPDRPIVSAFTNVLWDAQLFYKHNAFENMLDWLFETIRYFARRPDVQLVIRIHPAEAKGTMPTNQPLLAEIQQAFPTLPANVRVIPPESNLSSYTLAEMSCAALIYGARMGVELAALGTPLVVAGETFNRRKGYSYDVETRDEYFSLLDRVTELPRNSAEMVERARKYAYHYYYRLMIDFPLFSISDPMTLSGPRLEFDSLDDLMPGRHGSLDRVCDGILDGTTPFVYDTLEHTGPRTDLSR